LWISCIIFDLSKQIDMRTFTFTITDANGHQVEITAKASVYTCDGTMRSVDIDSAMFNGVDVANFVSAMQSDVWDSWVEKAEYEFKVINNEIEA
jgi:hypothetical protein